MHKLEQHVKNTIGRLGLLRRSSPVLVALSGGADSVALLSVLHALGYECIAAHCNFHLRGAESVRDMRHAEAVARQLGVNIYIREFNVAKRMRETGESVEMACRELRYAWFHDLLDRDYSQAIAVAHHREDNVETFFINLLRSAGLSGLTGMDFRRGYVVRPFLDVRRTEIENYLKDKGLAYVTDSTNAQNDFQRNRLRNVIIPGLENGFPGASDAVLSVMGHLGEAKNILDYTIGRLATRYTDSTGSFNVKALVDENPGLPSNAVLYYILKRNGLNRSQTDNILRAVMADSTGLRFDIDSDVFAELDRGIISFHIGNKNASRQIAHNVRLTHDVLRPVNIRITPHHITEFLPERNPNVIYLDSKVLDGNPVFEIRRYRTGDRIHPFGMRGEKLVSDVFADAKYTLSQKRDAWLLTRNDKILWVIGLRASALFTVNPETRAYLRLELV